MSTIVYLPYAGAGASAFRAWSALSAGRADSFAVQLPGREERFIDEPLRDVAAAAVDAVAQIRRAVPSGTAIVIFGHSLGAVLAFEVARRLEEDGELKVKGLVVSGSPGPWNGRSARASDLDDDAFLREVQRFAGYEHPALAMPELREILLPMLRADVQMHEDYLPDDRRPIRAPILTLRGTDDELVDSAQMEQWAEATTGGLRSVEISGPHMYLVEEPRRVVDAIVGKVLTPDVA